MTPFTRRDLILMSAIALAAGVIAFLFFRGVGVTFFYQTQMPAIAMAACGRGFLTPAPMPVSLEEFLFMRTPAFDCSALSAATDTRPIGTMTTAHLYLAGIVTSLWRLPGVNYNSLSPLVVVMHSAYAAGCFVLARLFFPSFWAFFVGLVISVSPLAVAHLFFLRDFSKAPFIIWALVLLILMTREKRAGRLVLFALLAGALIGMGMGFRTDVAVLFPVGIGIVLFGLVPGITDARNGV